MFTSFFYFKEKLKAIFKKRKQKIMIERMMNETMNSGGYADFDEYIKARSPQIYMRKRGNNNE